MLSDPGPAFDCLGDLADVAALHRAAIDALVARLGPYLRSIRFTRYHDVRVPVIAVSNDGSLGWLACEIEAEGQEVAPQGQGARVALGSRGSRPRSSATVAGCATATRPAHDRKVGCVHREIRI